MPTSRFFGTKLITGRVETAPSQAPAYLFHRRLVVIHFIFTPLLAPWARRGVLTPL